MRKQEGYTIIEVCLAISLFGVVVGAAGLLYVGIHFLMRHW